MILAFGFCEKGFDILSVDNLEVGIVMSHNKILDYAEQKLMGIWSRIRDQDVEDLVAVLNMKEDPRNLKRKLSSNAYDIILVPGQ